MLVIAQLSDTPSCTTFSVLRMNAAPIVRVAVEPRQVQERLRLAEGLRRLELSDPLCTVAVLDSGEHVVAAAGELHLERCLKDLRERFARIDLVISPPLFSFRETIVSDARKAAGVEATVETFTANRLVSLSVRASPLGSDLTRFLDEHADLLRALCADDLVATTTTATSTLSSDELCTPQNIEAFRTKLVALLAEAGLASHASSLWAFGPRRCGPNLLFCSAPPLASLIRTTGAAAKLQLGRGADLPAAAAESDEATAQLRDLATSFVTGFQVATSAGPMCEEPVTGVAFFLEQVAMHAGEQPENEHGQGLIGQVISASKEACRQAMLKHSPRLVEPYFLCDIQVHGACGRLHAWSVVLSSLTFFCFHSRFSWQALLGAWKATRKDLQGGAQGGHARVHRAGAPARGGEHRVQ